MQDLYQHPRADLAGTANQVVLSASGTGVLIGTAITLSLPQSIHTAASPTFAGLTLSTTPLAATSGGTGTATFALGDTLYSSAANTLAKLTGNITTTKKFLRQTGDGAASAAPAWDTVIDADVVFSDIATGNSSTTKHGYLKKLDNTATNYMDGAGNWSVPAGAGGGCTLDSAYDFGGAGVGRTILVNDGAVTLTGEAASTTVGGFTVNGTRTIASAAGAVWNEVLIDADVSLSGSTDVTTATGFNMVNLQIPTITDAGTITSITHAATLYIAGAPAGSGLTVTNAYALWVDSGVCRFDGQIRAGGGTAAIPIFATGVVTGTDQGMYSTTTTRLEFSCGGVEAIALENLSGSRSFTYTQPAGTSGAANLIMKFIAGAHTAATAGTEVLDIDFALTATLQHASNTAVATQRSFLIRNRTYSFASATGTITNAATFAIVDAPVVGTNAAITNSWALWVQAGRGLFDGGLLIGGEPTGLAGKVGYSNTVDTSANNIGVGTTLFKGATSRNTSGFLKILDGTTARYVPFYDAITG